jgi:hypothetical protein
MGPLLRRAGRPAQRGCDPRRRQAADTLLDAFGHRRRGRRVSGVVEAAAA